jgi:hypothetical protein
VCHSVDEWAVQEKSDGVRGGKDGDDNGELDLGEAYSFDRVLEGRLEEGKDLAIHVIQSRPGEFLHQKSGIEYRLFLRDKEVWLSYARPQGKGAMDIVGEQRLVYYIGSGHRGRTYLFERNGFWFESPVNWYSKTQLWDMNPQVARRERNAVHPASGLDLSPLPYQRHGHLAAG